MPKKVILDIDPGIDDALALCVALFDPALEVLAVTATGGVVGPVQSTRNVQSLLERIDPPHWPRLGGADPNQLLRVDGRDLHGANGLGGVELAYAEPAKGHGAVHLMSRLIREYPGDITLIGLGPMSNLAALLTLEPDMPNMVGEIIVAAGAICATGDVTAAAEFNVFNDAQAARDVLRARVTKTLIPLDTTSQLSFGYDLLEFLRSRKTRTAQLLAELLPEYFHARRQHLGNEEAIFGDVAAVLLAAHPRLFESESMYVDVETVGEITHGVTVCDCRAQTDAQHNAEVATSINAEAAREAVLAALDAAC